MQAFAFGDEDCPDIESCTKCCPLGRQRDDQGCFKCQCLKSGLFQGDIIISGKFRLFVYFNGIVKRILF